MRTQVFRFLPFLYGFVSATPRSAWFVLPKIIRIIRRGIYLTVPSAAWEQEVLVWGIE